MGAAAAVLHSGWPPPRVVTFDELRDVFHRSTFSDLFFGDLHLFLAWIDVETGNTRDRFIVRMEPGYPAVVPGFDLDKQRMSYGLFQIMGANLFQVNAMANQTSLWMSSVGRQADDCRQWMRRCPSRDIMANLAWWNTGHTDVGNPAAARYLEKIQTRKEKLDHDTNP